ADSDRHGLLADRDVKEPGQVSGSEALLDLLLEPPDQQHLTKELAQIRLRQRRFLLHLRHEGQFMLRPLRLVAQFNEIEPGLVDDWGKLTLQVTLADERRAERAATLLAPANPGRFATRIRFDVDRGGPGIGPEAVRRLLRRLDQERIEGTVELLHARKAPAEKLSKKEPLRDQWERRLELLPADWSDLYAQVS